MTNDEIISWLLEGDVSIQYQVNRDLLDNDKPQLRKKIESEGWGSKFLSYRKQNGHWGRSFYQPKWTSTHYTLLDLKNLNIPQEIKAIRDTLKIIFENEKGPDGGILPIGTIHKSDVCVNGMVLNYSSYFHVKEEYLKSVVDFLLSEKMDDGGFNCHSNRKGAIHSSLHTTLSVLEGIFEFEANGYQYRLKELKEARLKYDKRMDDAINYILSKKTVSGQWKIPTNHPGQTHFEMEKSGKPSRWNTLRALRVLRFNYKK